MSGHHKWSSIKHKKDSNMSDVLKWARKRGLNHEQDLMAETLRTLHNLTLVVSLGIGALVSIGLIMVTK